MMITLEKVEECLNHVNYIIAKSIQDPECKRPGISKVKNAGALTENVLWDCKECALGKEGKPCLIRSKLAACSDWNERVDTVIKSVTMTGFSTKASCPVKKKSLKFKRYPSKELKRFRTIKNMQVPDSFGLTPEAWALLREYASKVPLLPFGIPGVRKPFAWHVLESFNDCDILLYWFVEHCESNALTENYHFLDLVQQSLNEAWLVLLEDSCFSEVEG